MNVYYINIKNNTAVLGDSQTITGKNDGGIFVFEPVGTERRREKIIDPNNPLNSVIVRLINPWTYWNNETKLQSIRIQRDYLLSLSDWRVIRSAEKQTPESQAWLDYRQALRDFPNLVNVNLPIEQIVWPQQPS